MNRDDRFEQVLEDVADGRGTSSPDLSGLSHLLPEQVARLEKIWEGLSERQKLGLLQNLSQQETESLRLDFNAVHHLAMLDDSAEVRRQAVESTVEDSSPWLLEHLLKAVADDPDTEVRAAAAAALEPIAQRAELGELSDGESDRIKATLLETIHRPAERLDVRAAALAAVGYFSDPAVQQEIEVSFADEELRLQALRAMGHNADSIWLEKILPELEGPDDVLRRVAAEAAGEIGDEAAVPALTDLIDDPAHPVRLSAIAALGEIAGDEAREALVYALEDNNAEIREAAQAALEELDFYDEPLEL
jgi:HEAT repeat protein